MKELENTKSELENDPEKLAVLYNEMVQMCLWGNATVKSSVIICPRAHIFAIGLVSADESYP
jgi:hypothetical protein